MRLLGETLPPGTDCSRQLQEVWLDRLLRRPCLGALLGELRHIAAQAVDGHPPARADAHGRDLPAGDEHLDGGPADAKGFGGFGRCVEHLLDGVGVGHCGSLDLSVLLPISLVTRGPSYLAHPRYL